MCKLKICLPWINQSWMSKPDHFKYHEPEKKDFSKEPKSQNNKMSIINVASKKRIKSEIFSKDLAKFQKIKQLNLYKLFFFIRRLMLIKILLYILLILWCSSKLDCLGGDNFIREMFNLLSSKQMEGEGDKHWKMLDPTFEGQYIGKYINE